MNKEIIAIKNPLSTCCKCLEEKEHINHILIKELGYGSGFDGVSIRLNLCDECIKETNEEWWKLEVIKNGYEEEYKYKYEKEIFDFVRKLPLSGQEIFWNRYSEGTMSDPILDPQDWIDYNLGKLSHEKCKEYGLYSYQEIQAYKDRFPTCGKVFVKVFPGGSSGCYCPYGASGNSDGSCGVNISDECYLCSNYTPKINEMKTEIVLDEFVKREIKRLEEAISLQQKKLEEIKKYPLKYYEEN